MKNNCTIYNKLESSFLNQSFDFESFIQTTPLNDLPSFCKEEATFEANFLHKPKQKLISIQPRAWISRMTLNKVAAVILTTFTWPFSNLSIPDPTKFGLMTTLSFYNAALLHPLKKIWKKASTYFTEKNTHLAVAALVGYIGLSFLAKWVEDWSGIKRSILLDEHSYRNLNTEVQENKIHLLPTQRTKQIQDIVLSLTDCLDEITRDQCPILVGPPGTGKTAAVSNLVYQTQKLGMHPALIGKTFYAINAAHWAMKDKHQTTIVDSSDSMINDVASDEPFFAFLDVIKGSEKDTVLFLDESHCLSKKCIELLKTYIAERQLKVIFATTQKEYEKVFAKNPAFDDRLKKIEFPSLLDSDTKTVLQDLFSKEKTQMEIQDEAFDAIIQLGHTLPHYKDRANPRKSIQLASQVVKESKEWIPTQILQELQSKEQEIATLQRSGATAILAAKKLPDATADKLKTLYNELETLKEKEKKINDLYLSIRNLQRFQRERQQNLCEIVHQIKERSDEPSEHDKKVYLLNKVALKAIDAALQKQALEFEQLSSEKIPLIMTAEHVKAFLKS